MRKTKLQYAKADQAGKSCWSSHLSLQNRRVPSRSLCRALLSKLIGLAKSNTVMTSPVFTLLQCYSEGRRVEDTEVYLEYEPNDYFEVWRFFCCCFYFCSKLLVFETGLTSLCKRQEIAWQRK